MPPDSRQILEFARSVNAILLIPHGRAGSFFIQSLFDGHPQIISFPSYFSRYGWDIKEAKRSFSNFIDHFCEENSDFFDSTKDAYITDTNWNTPSLLGDGKNENFSIDIQSFKESFLRAIEILAHSEDLTHKDLAIALHAAFAEATGRDLKDLKFILVHQHGGDRYSPSVDSILKDFPNLYFIVPIRDLRESWLGFQSLLTARWGPQDYFNFTLRNIRLHVSLFNELLDYFPRFREDHVRLVDLERLHLIQADGMKALSVWLGIRFHPTLVKSTFFGKTWWGNASDGKALDSFSTSRTIYKWPTKLAADEIQVVEYLSCYLSETFRFKAPEMPTSARQFYGKLFLHPPIFNTPKRNSAFYNKLMSDVSANKIKKLLLLAYNFAFLGLKSFVFFLDRFSPIALIFFERRRRKYSRHPARLPENVFL